jgi:hypothetical protein
MRARQITRSNIRTITTVSGTPSSHRMTGMVSFLLRGSEARRMPCREARAVRFSARKMGIFNASHPKWPPSIPGVWVVRA